MEKISIAYWGSGRVTTFKWHSVGCSCFQTPARMGWTADDIPSQEGRVVLVTGANSGLVRHANNITDACSAVFAFRCASAAPRGRPVARGRERSIRFPSHARRFSQGLESARALYKKGATVVMACRSEERARKAMADIEDSCKGTKGVGKLEFLQMDTSEPDSGERGRTNAQACRADRGWPSNTRALHGFHPCAQEGSGGVPQEAQGAARGDAERGDHGFAEGKGQRALQARCAVCSPLCETQSVRLRSVR